MADLRGLPSVDQLLQTDHANELIARYGRPLTVESARSALAEARQILLDGKESPPVENKDFFSRMDCILADWLAPSLRSVINASGVILHTNLGRAPLSQASLRAINEISGGYSTLEFDLATGRRGSRSVHVEGLLKRVTGAEAALIVSNNAAALLLCLTALARRKRVVIARSQLVEIGGGFRIPDVMKQSGATLVEVGTTNRVYVRDYGEALEQPAGLVLRVHSSNFRIIGFTTTPDLNELVNIAHANKTLFLDDIGSGALLDTAGYGLTHEPTVHESLAAGADLVCFSGDKLLGGPQAGIIVGNAGLIEKIKKHPLARAVRADKLCLAALSATLQHYLKDEVEQEIPVWRMIAARIEALHERANRLCEALGRGDSLECLSTVGGGSLPEDTLAGWGVAIQVSRPNNFLKILRAQNPPVIARVENEQILFDLRTVLPEQDENLLAAVRQALKGERGNHEK
jgi:L-seryl-tRNA(Ser) seleniumtransferase